MEFHLGRQTGKKVVEERLRMAEVKATPMQVEEVVKRIRAIQDALDKGEAQMTFYQVKKLMKDLRKGMTEEEFWRIVEQVTKQKPKLSQPTTKTSG
jgi:isopropylmalate/homocitrate/citramalate synthase